MNSAFGSEKFMPAVKQSAHNKITEVPPDVLGRPLAPGQIGAGVAKSVANVEPTAFRSAVPDGFTPAVKQSAHNKITEVPPDVLGQPLAPSQIGTGVAKSVANSTATGTTSETASESVTTAQAPLPPASAATVRDPDWIAEKLRRALASEYPEALARKFLGDLSMWTTDADAVVAALTDRPSLPALDWDRRYSLPRQRTGDALIPPYMPSLSALISDWEHDDHLVVAQQWAAELGLSEIPEPGRGIRAWTGDHDGWYVEVWIISDRAAFDAARR